MIKIICNDIDGIILDKLWNNPECIQKAEIKQNKLVLYCIENIPIFAGLINYPDTPVKGIKFEGNSIKITI